MESGCQISLELTWGLDHAGFSAVSDDLIPKWGIWHKSCIVWFAGWFFFSPHLQLNLCCLDLQLSLKCWTCFHWFSPLFVWLTSITIFMLILCVTHCVSECGEMCNRKDGSTDLPSQDLKYIFPIACVNKWLYNHISKDCGAVEGYFKVKFSSCESCWHKTRITTPQPRWWADIFLKLPFCCGSHLHFLLSTIFLYFWGVLPFLSLSKPESQWLIKKELRWKVTCWERKDHSQAVSGVPSKPSSDPFSIGCSVYLEDYFSRISFLFFFPLTFFNKKRPV